jgi:hypothetical protein
MASSDKTGKGEDASFSFGVRELAQARDSVAPARDSRPLALDAGAQKGPCRHAGFDPYNTSGSFDRKKNWLRVGKR